MPPPPKKRGAKKPWAKPSLYLVGEVLISASGPKQPNDRQSYEGSPTHPYQQYMPQSATQALNPS